MTLDQIDAELADWERKLRAATDNMLELRSSPAYQRLAGDGTGAAEGQLSGATAGRAQPALDGLHTLWIYYSLLRETMDRARSLRASISPLLPSRNVLGEIERLLHGPSIALPALATPLEQRNLLAPAEVAQSVRPEQMLATMHQLFQQGRDVVFAIGAAWDNLPAKLASLEAELSALAAGDGCSADAMAGFRGRLEAVRRQGDADPLAAADGCEALAAEVAGLRGDAKELAAERQRVGDDLAAARRLAAEVGDWHGRAVDTDRRCELKVCCDGAAQRPRPAGDDTVAALEAWLARLETEVSAGRWQPVRVGLQRWTAAARRALDADRAALGDGELLLNQRRDLRGLLGALKAKAQANGRAEDPALAGLESEASALLATRPTPLERLQSLVADYEQRLL